MSLFECPGDESKRSDVDSYKRSYTIAPWTTNWSNDQGAFRGWRDRELNLGVPSVIVENPSTAAVILEWHADPNLFGSLGHQYHEYFGPVGGVQHNGFTNVLMMDGHIEKVSTAMPSKEFTAKFIPGEIGQLK